MNFRFSVFILIVFSVLAGIHLYFYARNIDLKYRITDLKINLSELTSRKRELGSQVTGEENLAQIEKIAREKLNMIYPRKIIYIPASQQLLGSKETTTDLRPEDSGGEPR